VTRSNTQTQKIGTSKRGDIVDKRAVELPGPGNYDGNMDLIGKNAKKVTIGVKAPRKDDTLGPGPGGYNNEASIVKPN
jgi:hypothetical protein